MKRALTLPTDGNEKGQWAEQLAERWLRSQGLTPHTQNYTRRLGEIDLILRDESNNAWVFVEVKYRGARAKVSGVDAITAAKQRKLRRTAQLFLQAVRDQTSAARIDVIVITQRTNVGTDQNNKRLNQTENEPSHYHERIGDYELLWIQNAVTG